MSALDTIVFVVEEGKIIEGPIRSFDGYIETTCTPLGAAPKFHTRGNELWSWGYMGQHPALISQHDTEEDARSALEASFAHDFWNCQSINAFVARADAEEFLQAGS